MSDAARLRDVAYVYAGQDRGLTPISLDVPPGGAVLVTGPSGSGKSTLARCVGGLIPHLYRGELGGEVWLDGLPTASTPLWRLAERAGLVFQNPAAQVLTASVEEEIVFGLENLGLPSEVVEQRLEAALDRFGLGDLRARSPHTLSGGEQQKLALAAVMARQPPVLILDEPLSMLDSTAAADLVEHLGRLVQAGTSVVVCEHRAAYVQPVPGLRTVRLEGSSGAETSPDNAPYRVAGRPSASRFTLEISDLSVRLGSRPVLEGISFSARSGQVVAVVGRNGVGKTTLLRALTGLQEHRGTVSVDGRRPDFGMVFQNPDLQLFNATVRDEMLYGVPDPDLDRYAWILGTLGLTRYEQTPPLLLSEGEKKRLALALTLIRAPRDGILLDEPALGQDSAHKETLVRLARALAEGGQLVIMATHDLALAAEADRLLLLGQSGVVADGPPDDVLRDEACWASVGMRVPSWVMSA